MTTWAVIPVKPLRDSKRRLEHLLSAEERAALIYQFLDNLLTVLDGLAPRLLPGSEFPTVIPLEGAPDKIAIHAVCRENVFWETLEGLKAAGATSVLVLPVEKMLA